MKSYKSVLVVNGGIQELVKRVEYAVRGELVLKALEYQDMLKVGKLLPFKDLIFCNIGNPQSVGNPYITFYRRIISLVMSPDLLDLPLDPEIFSPEMVEFAREIVNAMGPGGLGSYSHSQGVPLFRQWVAEFIEKRDGHKCNPDNIFLTDGASPGVKTAMQLLIRQENDGIMVPIPQYPLYSATIDLLGGQMVRYYLDEEAGWALNVKELERAYEQAQVENIEVRALCVINPGNPTSQCLSESNMREIVNFCEEKNVVLMADEVYQENVYSGTWVSFKKVVCDMESPIELISYHSVSKGMVGECGLRGGYSELVNIEPEVQQQWYKLASVSLCPNTVGQLATALMVHTSDKIKAMESVIEQKNALYESYKSRAEIVRDTLNSLEGVSCQTTMGAMYAFPTITLPPKAIAAATKDGKKPDTFYCLSLLAATGICVVPGNGFGQADGTFHFRTTFLPPEDKMQEVADRLTKFHKLFMEEFREDEEEAKDVL